MDYLREHALEYGYDVVMYGHTHVPYIEIGDDVTILNPGSISYPRQAGRKPTFLDHGDRRRRTGTLCPWILQRTV